MTDPVLRLTLPDGRAATVRVGEASTVLAVGDTTVSAWDLAGRPYALVRNTGTYRRGLDGRLLRKREATAGEPRVRERLDAAGGAPVVEAARQEAEAALQALAAPEPVSRRSPDEAPPPLDENAIGEARRRLRLVTRTDARALADDAARFSEACGPVGILPPDQYLSLVVRITEGCSWDACTFCRLYEGTPFRARTREEVARHVALLREYFGESIALRRSVFLGDANALCVSSDRLLPLLDTVAAALPGRPLYSFVDGWTGSRKSAVQWRACRARGLRRVYVGLETGDPDLLARLGKPGSPLDAVRLVTSLHGAGVAAGVIVLLGAGGEASSSAHARRTAEVLAQMELGREDIVYFSEYLPEAGRSTAGSGERVLGIDAIARQRADIAAVFDRRDRARRPRLASYDLREFTF